jgi:hypothetical protein
VTFHIFPQTTLQDRVLISTLQIRKLRVREIELLCKVPPVASGGART